VIALIGGRVITVTGPILKNGVVLFDERNGKIMAVGSKDEVSVPDDAEVIEVHDKVIAPGLVDAHSHIGVIPEGLDWEYSDVNDFYSPVTPHLRALDAIDPYDEGFKHALEGGVTTVYTGPGSANVIGGIGTIMKTYGASLRDMVMKGEAALKMALGPKRPREYKSKIPYPTTRMGTVAMLRSWLIRAKELSEGKLKEDKIDPEEKLMLQVISRVLKGELLAKIHLSTSPDEIYAIVNLIEEFGLRATIDHVFGGQLVADMLAAKRIPVVYGPPLIPRRAAYFKYISDEAPVIMYRKGVNVSIMTDHPVIPQKHLRVLAAVTVKNGLSLDEALKLITINPARALGIADRVGSIEPGKDADIIVASDHPIKPRSRIDMVFVRGKLAYKADA